LKNLIGNFFKRIISYYKDHYVMPRKFLPQLAVSNRNNIVVINHLIFVFSIIAMTILHIRYWGQLQSYIYHIIYFTFFLSFSFIGLVWCAILKRKKETNFIFNNAPLLICSLGCQAAVLYRFFMLNGHFNAVLLWGVLTVLLIVLFDIEPLFFVVLNPITTALFIPSIYKDFGWTGVFDLVLFSLVVIGLSYYARKLSIKSLLKTEMLNLHKEGLQWEVEQRIEEINQKEADLIAQHKKLILVQDSTIIGLSNLVENRDSDTGEHVRRTAAYVGILATALMEKGLYTDILNPDYISLAIKAAPLHDIGKIVVSDSILKKPSKLTYEEFEEIKRHTTEGKRIVLEILGNSEDADYVKMAQEIAYGHHEKWNGTGYPLGLKNQDIPLSARIMAIADVFDALVSPRCYKEPIPVEAAFKILEEGIGTHFDPVMIPVFLEEKKHILSVIEKYKD